MKRYLSIILLLFTLHICQGWAIGRGIPFFKNFSAVEYGAHNQNFDVVCDDYGTVFVANFEGLLYYDGSTWRKIHTPGISRITCLAKGNDGRIWIGGYNAFGYLNADKHGCLQMKLIMSDAKSMNNSEVDRIKVTLQSVYLHTSEGKIFRVDKGDKLVSVIVGGSKLFTDMNDSLLSIQLPDKVSVSYKNTSGLCFTMPNGNSTYLNETDGLITNQIKNITFNGKHTLWGAMQKGLFCAEVSTPYSHLTEKEGLKGEVYCVNEIGNTIYIGTQNGLYSLRNGQLQSIKEINLACWNLYDNGHDQLIAATSQGLFIVSANGVRQLTRGNTLCAYIEPSKGDYIVGETEGVYRVSPSGQRQKVANIDKVLYITREKDGLNLQTIYGSLWKATSIYSQTFTVNCIRKEADVKQPTLVYHDHMGRLWKTDANRMNLTVQGGKTYDDLNYWIHPLCNKVLNDFHVCKDGNIIAGGDFGIIIIDAAAMSMHKIQEQQKPYIRQFVAISDSIFWGGYSQGNLKPVTSLSGITLPSSCHHVMVSFSSPISSLVSPTLYRYRLDGANWSAWSPESSVTFKVAMFGNIKLEIQALDAFGRLSDISTVQWEQEYPWFIRWWALLFYLIVILYLITLFFNWREKRLEHEKEKLEGIVAERTSELSKAYDEQQKISAELSTTLDDLKRTQDDLIHMERTATAGKLTQGLIDRILNPINYINNFSKLTSGLAKDLKEDIEDEKDNMSEDNYEDCEDILGMMDQNLTKIEEHGVNTTRTLRAMEAMLNYRIGALVNQDICPLCKQVVDVTAEHFKTDIASCGINIHADLPDQPVMVNIDAEAINRVLFSLLSNSVYAVIKKKGQTGYKDPEISIQVKVVDGHAVITTHDNGIGIEDTIKEKVFDPFFTTKTTGEAAGVGLYLVREIITDHKGTITLNSVKGEFCEFIITL